MVKWCACQLPIELEYSQSDTPDEAILKCLVGRLMPAGEIEIPNELVISDYRFHRAAGH